ncbi:unnamed protein product, partial [Brassica oleracea]
MEGMEKHKELETTSNYEERGSISSEKDNREKIEEAESEGNQKGEENQIKENTVKDIEWLYVSPGKTSRSPPRFGQVSILTKSRFEVLSPVENGEISGKINEEEELLEDEEFGEETEI